MDSDERSTSVPVGSPGAADPSAGSAALRHIQALSEVARSLSQALDPSELFTELSRVTSRLLGTSGVTVYGVDPGRGSVTIAHISGAGSSELPALIERGLQSEQVRRLLLDGVEDFYADLDTPAAVSIWSTSTSTRPPGVSALARLPLRVAGELLGVLSLRWATPHPFSDPERELLRDLAAHAAVALRNAQLFRRERRLRLVAVASAALARTALNNPPSFIGLGDALDTVSTLTRAAGAAIGLADAEFRAVRYVAANGSLAHLQGTTVPLNERFFDQDAEPGAEMAERDQLPANASSWSIRGHERNLGILWLAQGDKEEPLDTAAVNEITPALALAAQVIHLNEVEGGRRAREQMLATALNTMDQAVVLMSLDRRVRYANPAAERLYGFSAGALTDLQFDDLVANGGARRQIVEAIPLGVWSAEHVHQKGDGSNFPATVHFSHIRDEQGAPIGQVVVVRDLTDERKTAEQLRQNEKLAALGELVAGVAHELNNPLAGISAFAQLLMEEPMDPEHADSVRLIKREADRAVGVIRDLLLFSRKSGPSFAAVDINEMVEHTLRLRGYGLRSGGIDVRMELAANLPRVPGDLPRLQQVLLNLVINAEQALQGCETRRLVVRSELANEGIALSVSDSGRGMTEDTRQHIFEPFFTTKPVGEGTGLGLSVSYGIIRAHGGDIQVASQEGAGTTFRILLPVAGAATSAA